MDGIVFKALRRATEAHSKQLRKDGITPYIVHPFTVSFLLVEAGSNKNQLAAGLLHDVIEDTDYTEDELLEEFGSRIHLLVMACTEDKSIPDWQTRKDELLSRLEKVPEAHVIKAADTLANLTDLVQNIHDHGLDFLKEFHSTPKMKIDYYKHVYDIARGDMPDSMRRYYRNYLKELGELTKDL
jgi:(p)ppGpp synthase/HD superfamily hydrolase